MNFLIFYYVLIKFIFLAGEDTEAVLGMSSDHKDITL